MEIYFNQKVNLTGKKQEGDNLVLKEREVSTPGILAYELETNNLYKDNLNGDKTVYVIEYDDYCDVVNRQTRDIGENGEIVHYAFAIHFAPGNKKNEFDYFENKKLINILNTASKDDVILVKHTSDYYTVIRPCEIDEMPLEQLKERINYNI